MKILSIKLCALRVLHSSARSPPPHTHKYYLQASAKAKQFITLLVKGASPLFILLHFNIAAFYKRDDFNLPHIRNVMKVIYDGGQKRCDYSIYFPIAQNVDFLIRAN